MTSALLEVTVVIPTRDRWPLLRRTLRCALEQEGVRHEVVVVDDGSNDETVHELERCSDPRLRLVRHAAPLGQSRARNAGIREAGGRWIAFLDDDDLWSPMKLRAQLDVAGALRADWVYAGAVAVDTRGWPRFALAAPPPEGVAALLRSKNVVPAGTSNVMARTELVRSLGGFDETLDHLMDWDLWLRLAGHARAGRDPQTRVAYVLHSGNRVRSCAGALFREIDRLAERHGIERDIDPVAVRRWLGGAYRREGRRWAAASAFLRSAQEGGGGSDVLRALGSLLGDRVSNLVRRGERPAPPPWLTALLDQRA